jgi:hypothetical protein
LTLRPYSDESHWDWDDAKPGEVRIYNSLYGCDSECEYVRIEVSCMCGHEWESGEFGEFENEMEWQEYVDSLMKEYDTAKTR